jgi:hypothetical protein
MRHLTSWLQLSSIPLMSQAKNCNGKQGRTVVKRKMVDQIMLSAPDFVWVS